MGVFPKPAAIAFKPLEQGISVSNSALVRIRTGFGKTPIDVDKLPYSINWQRELLVNERLYSSYQQQYIKKADSKKINSWQILANRLKQS
jgi:hypothetical protein